MTSVIKPSSALQVPAGAAKKPRAARRAPAAGIFGLLSGWKIDTQGLKDELRD